MPARRIHPLIAVLLTTTVAAGCGGGKKAASSEPATSRTATRTTTTGTGTTTGTTTSGPSGGGIDTMPTAGTKPVNVKATNSATALLTDVRAARHEGFDRVVFQFKNTLPGYDVRYVQRPVTEEGSGRTVAVKGAYVVRVRMENALDADLTQASAPRTYTGPMRLSPATSEVVELARAGGFEGTLTWVVGLNDRVDFRVTTLQAPPRLVVDFRNH